MSKDIYNPDHYLNEAGYDLFEEWYIRYPFEVFRIIMWCTAERYFRRYFNKNGVEDLRKGMRVVERLEEYEERYSNEKYDWDRVAKTTINSIEGDEMDTRDIRYMPPKTISSDYNPTQLPKIPNYNEVLTEYEKEFLERYSNEKYDKFEEELEEAVLYGLPEKDSKKGDTDGDVEIFRTFYYKEVDVLEAVYKALQDVSTESIYFYPRASLEELKEAIYDRLDALKSWRQ